MRVVTNLDASSDWQQAGIDRYALMLSTFINSGKSALLSPEFRTIAGSVPPRPVSAFHHLARRWLSHPFRYLN